MHVRMHAGAADLRTDASNPAPPAPRALRRSGARRAARLACACLVPVLTHVGRADAAQAQQAPEGLRRAMSAFQSQLRTDSAARAFLPFFPETGAWEYVDTKLHRSGALHSVGRRRFAPQHTLAALRRGSPVCHAFTEWGELANPWPGPSRAPVRPWRYVGAHRFVPADGPARSARFVQWRREAGRWVVVSIGGRSWHAPEVLGVVLGPTVVLPGTTVAPPPAGLAENQAWYREGEPITYAGEPRVRFGLPRAIEPEALDRVGTLRGVPVFSEKGAGERPEVLYVLVRPGLYQPYQTGHKVRQIRCRT